MRTGSPRQHLPLLPERAQLIVRIPFDPPYTKEDLPQLDILHDLVGLGEEWMKSDTRYELFVGVHHSHNMLDAPMGRECSNCWGCMCHSKDILKEPCKGLELSRDKDK